MKEDELKNIVKNVQTANAPATPNTGKQTKKKVTPLPDKSEAKSLQEKIMEQKVKLKQQSKARVVTSTKEIVRSKNKESQELRTNYHKGKIIENVNKVIKAAPVHRQAKTKGSETTIGNGQERGEKMASKSTSSKIFSPQPKRTPKAEKEEEPRFDTDNFTKSGAAFNMETNISQSQLKTVAAGLEETSFTEKIIERNSMKHFSSKVPPLRSLSSEERAFAKCTFNPRFAKCPNAYSRIEPRLLKHFDPPLTERPSSLANSSFVHKSFNRVCGDDPNPFVRSASKRKAMAHSSSVDRLGVSIGGASADFTNLSNCFNNLKVSVFEKPNDNFFDIKSNRDLGYILKHGYTFRQHERKHYTAKKSVDAYRRAGQEFLNITSQNRSVMESLCQPKVGQKTSGQLNISASSQNLYADLFTERYRKLTKNIMDDLKESDGRRSEIAKTEEAPDSVTEDRVTEEFVNAKKNRVYKELGININLKEIFGGLGYDELMKLRKLHVLYANQKGKAKGKSGAKEVAKEAEA